jgi:MoaA/NifB/PqqE/SkfB family radical SAM enzyme
MRLQVPLTAHLDLTYRCSWRCVFCSNPRHHDAAPLSVGEWSRVLGELRGLGVLFVTLSGGDPLDYPGFFEVAETARARALALRIFTNGHRVDAGVADRLAALRPVGVELSLHGSTAGTHDRSTRVAGSFGRLWRAVALLRARGVRTILKMVLTRLNEGELEDAVALAEAEGVQLRVDPMVAACDDGDERPLRYQASAGGVARLLAKLAAAGRVPTVRRRSEGGVNCGLGRMTLAIDPEGNVYPCALWRSGSLGNVRERGLDEMWSESPVRREAADTAVAANERMRTAGGALARYPFCPAAAARRGGGDALTPWPEHVAQALAADALRRS